MASVGIQEQFDRDADGNPDGGTTTGTGIAITWQKGPLGRDGKRIAPNGAFLEDVVKVGIGKLKDYQNSKFKCRENAIALTHLETALLWLQERTRERDARGVEGTHAV